VSASEYCCAAVDGCKNPAGYATRNGACGNPDPPRTRAECSRCGGSVCASCRVKRGGRWVCDTCLTTAEWKAAHP